MTDHEKHGKTLEVEDIERMLAIAQQRGAERRRARALEAQANGTPDFYDLAVRLCADMPAGKLPTPRTKALALACTAMVAANILPHMVATAAERPTQNASVGITCNDMCNADEVYADTDACLHFNPIQ